MYEKANVKGVGYKNVEIIVQTQPGLAGNKLVEKESGSGNVITERTELEAQRDWNLADDYTVASEDDEWYLRDFDEVDWEQFQDLPWEVRAAIIDHHMDTGGFVEIEEGTVGGTSKDRLVEAVKEVLEDEFDDGRYNGYADDLVEAIGYQRSSTASSVDIAETRHCCPDYINFSKEAEFEYMPVSYQTGTYDQKWIEKLCVQNYYIGAVVVEMYTHAEHLQKNTEVKTRRDCAEGSECGKCNGALEANFNSNVIGVAHIGWLSKDPTANDKGRHDEYGRSVEDLTGVFSIEKFIQLWGNDTCGAVQVDWLPCI